MENQQIQTTKDTWFDARTKKTMLWFTVGSFVYQLIVQAGSAFAYSAFIGEGIEVLGVEVASVNPYGFDLFEVIFASVIGGVIGGFLLAKLWNILQKISRNYLNDWFTGLYRLLFRLTVVVVVLDLFIGTERIFRGGSDWTMFMLAIALSSVVGAYFMAKIVASTLKNDYPTSFTQN